MIAVRANHQKKGNGIRNYLPDSHLANIAELSQADSTQIYQIILAQDVLHQIHANNFWASKHFFCLFL